MFQFECSKKQIGKQGYIQDNTCEKQRDGEKVGRTSDCKGGLASVTEERERNGV